MIRLANIGVGFRNGGGQTTWAVRDFNLDIGVEFMAVVGPSGCGKTTVLRLLAGLLAPTEGSIELPVAVEFAYGIVFQDYSLLPWLDVQQNIELGLKVRKITVEQREEVSARLLMALGLSDVRDYLPHQLSGGMRQRVAVGRAFAQSPTLLLMDEPFGALDAITRTGLQDALVHLYEADPHTVVFVTHDVEEALFLADRICVLSPRPGAVKQLLDVPFKRPRQQVVKRAAEFVALKYLVEDVLRN